MKLRKLDFETSPDRDLCIEVAPFIKTGGLGDVAGSLPKALAAEGNEVAVFCPLYSAIPQIWREKLTYLKNAYVQLGWRNQYCGVFHYADAGVDYYFIDNEYYFARSQIYGEYDDAERFAFFSKAVLEILPISVRMSSTATIGRARWFRFTIT